jgi:hypothetical protein
MWSALEMIRNLSKSFEIPKNYNTIFKIALRMIFLTDSLEIALFSELNHTTTTVA